MFRLVLALAALVVSAVPVAMGQAPSTAPEASMTSEVEDVGPEGRLKPESELASVNIVLAIACELPPSAEHMVVMFSVGKLTPAYSTVIFNPTQQSLRQNPTDCADPEHRSLVKTTAIVSTTRDAPAFAVFETIVEATVRGSSKEYGPFATSFNLTNDFIPLTQVAPASYFQKAGQDVKVVFPITVSNLGNGAVEVTTSVSQPNENKLDAIVTPGGIRLESRAQKGAAALFRQNVVVETRTPSGDFYTNKIYSFNVNFTSRSTDGNDTDIDSTNLVLSIQVQGTAAGAPGPSVVILVVAAVGAALVQRKRHRS